MMTHEIVLTAQQQLAVDHCVDLTKRVVAITGPAGSGKTTIIKMVHSLLQTPDASTYATTNQTRTTTATGTQERRLVLSAPTGKAARRISEATGIPAMTVHKLLEFGKPDVDPNTGEAKSDSYAARHKDNPLNFTDIIVDEYAMVNEELHRSLVDALPRGGRLLAFGDLNQLPPIEPHELSDNTSPFERLLALPNSVRLEKVFRQGEESGIIRNATRILAGMAVSRFQDFQLEISDSPILVLRNHLRNSGLDYMDTANQIITPARVGKLGSVALNQVVQAYYNDRLGEDSMMLTRHKWQMKDKDGNELTTLVHVNDKVIVNENTYDLRDFFSRFQKFGEDNLPDWRTFIPPHEDQQMLNGEIGTITEINEDDGHFTIKFPDRYVDVPFTYREWNPKAGTVYEVDPRKRIDLGYVVTTHKMQGSECNHVCFITHSIARHNLNRNNLYTAITRAKKGVTYIADQQTWRSGAKLTAKVQQKLREEYAANKKRTSSTKKTEIRG